MLYSYVTWVMKTILCKYININKSHTGNTRFVIKELEPRFRDESKSHRWICQRLLPKWKVNKVSLWSKIELVCFVPVLNRSGFLVWRICRGCGRGRSGWLRCTSAGQSRPYSSTRSKKVHHQCQNQSSKHSISSLQC